MKIVDSLLIAPVIFCAIAALVGLLTDIRLATLFQGVAAASMAALMLHWLIGRRGRRRRSASADRG
jgi:hypothetical protein